MDDQEPLLKELREIKKHLARIDLATNWLLTLAELLILSVFVFRVVQWLGIVR
jgi:hypothetical protein